MASLKASLNTTYQELKKINIDDIKSKSFKDLSVNCIQKLEYNINYTKILEKDVKKIQNIKSRKDKFMMSSLQNLANKQSWGEYDKENAKLNRQFSNSSSHSLLDVLPQGKDYSMYDPSQTRSLSSSSRLGRYSAAAPGVNRGPRAGTPVLQARISDHLISADRRTLRHACTADAVKRRVL